MNSENQRAEKKLGFTFSNEHRTILEFGVLSLEDRRLALSIFADCLARSSTA